MRETKRKMKYDPTLPGRMYRYFVGYGEIGAPSYAKFARAAGFTLAELESFREHKKFERAWRECGEIRRDYLIDMALTKRHDSSFSKFLLQSEYGVGEAPSSDGSEMNVTVEVLDG